VSGTSFGISLQSSCTAPALSPAKNNVVITNEINGANTGVWLGAQSLSGSTVCNPELNENLVSLNNINDPGGLNGIFVGQIANGLSYTPEAVSNALTFNGIYGYATPILNEGTDTIIEGNKY
jgi:hypothetical protein